MKKINLSYLGIIGLILLASFSRIIPHIPNFTPIGAIALFGGAYFKNKLHSFIIPFLSLWISDLLINNYILSYYEEFTWFYPGFLWQYSSFCVIILIGNFFLKKLSLKKIFLSIITSSLLFFIITNFGVWISGSLYPLNINGLITCYFFAIPFFKGTLLGFLFYSSFLFGAFEIFKSRLVLNNQF
ncbi:MAG: hypothetical protein P8L83_05865 [Flavobacteriaceae bacterium]|nr:hypothetical protein [Flavobacteriaceae bacterium]